MEVYKESSAQNDKFKKLLLNTFSKSRIEEGKILNGKISKITDKHCYILIEGLKSEALLDISELKATYPNIILKENNTVEVYLEKIEDPRTGECIVSASKAARIKGFWTLQKAFETNETIKGKLVGKIKGGAIGSHTETGALFFVPGSQLSNRVIKSFDDLFNKELEFKVVKCDTMRGNVLCSRREVLNSQIKEKKEDIISKYSVNQIIDDAVIKGFSSFGVFVELNSEIDSLIHQSHISHSRITNVEELFTIGQKIRVQVIEVDKTKMQISCSIKALTPSPFDNIAKYSVGSIYPAKIISIATYGLFVELESGLTCLAHSSQLSYKKNVTPNKLFKVGQTIDVLIQEIDIENSRVAVSHKLTKMNPFQSFANKYPQFSTVKGTISKIKDLSIFIHIKEFDIDIYLNAGDISWLGKPEDEVKKLNIGDEIEVKVIEINPEEQKVRTSVRALEDDPFKVAFKEKKAGDIITVKVKYTSSQGITVTPENSDMEILIKKNQIAINTEDRRPNRFVKDDRIDTCITSISFDKRKIELSMKSLEEKQNKLAVAKFSSNLSGRSLPFSSLSEKLDKKLDNKKKDEDK